ncbi:MAG: hypothetical protein WCI36_00590 [bacterium]
MEKYSFENAQKEAGVMKEKIKSGEAQNYQEAANIIDEKNNRIETLQSDIDDSIKIEELRGKIGAENKDASFDSFATELPRNGEHINFGELQKVGNGGTHDVFISPQNPSFAIKLNRGILNTIINSGQSEFIPEMQQNAEKLVTEKNAEYDQLYKYFGQKHCLRERMQIQKISVEKDGEIKNIEGLISIQESSDVFKDPNKKDFSASYAETMLTEENKESYEMMNEALLADGDFKAEDFLKFNEKLAPIFDLIEKDKDFANSMQEFLLRFKEYFNASGKFIDLVGEENVLFHQKDGEWTFQIGSVLKAESRQNIEEALKILEENPEQLNVGHLKGNLKNGLALIRMLNATGMKAGIGKIVDIPLSKTQLNNLGKVNF